jgi:hypothetical protein
MAILPDVPMFVGLPEIPALAAWTAGRPASARAAAIGLMKRRAAGALDPAELATLADLAVGPDTPARRGSAEFLALVFRLNAKRDPDAFDKLFDTGRYAALFAAAEKDRTAGDSQLAAWARRQWLSMLRIDREAISKGLFARWTLDTLGQGQFNDSGPSGRNLNAKNLSQQSVVPGILGKALLCTNENVAVEWGNQTYRGLQSNDYSIAAWINVIDPKATWGDPESVVFGADVGGRTSGLVLGTNGILGLNLPVMVFPDAAVAADPKKQPQPAGDRGDNRKNAGEPQKRSGKRVVEFIRAVATEPLETNRWYHVVAAVRRSANEVSLYINGDVAARGVPKTDAAPCDVNGPLRIGSARSMTKERRTSCVFRGMVDEVRIYDRAITDTDAGMLFAQGETDP